MIKVIAAVLCVAMIQVIPGISLKLGGERSVNAYHSRIAQAVGE